MHKLLKIDAKKSLGQHFLTSPVVPGWMCDAADISHNDIVLEIGPGTGVLTSALLMRGAQVIALETDERAGAALTDSFCAELASSQLTLIHADIRKIDLSEISNLQDRQFKVVANIPYYLSGLLFRTLLESTLQPSDLVYLVQKEVAKRGCSSISTGEKESLLSLSLQVYGTPRYVKTVSRGHFTPPPKVDSAIIAVRNISKKNFDNLSEALFFEILHLGFGQKRKQLLGNLAKHYDRELLTHSFSTAEIPVSARAEDIPLDKWLTLAKLLTTHR